MKRTALLLLCLSAVAADDRASIRSAEFGFDSAVRDGNDAYVKMEVDECLQRDRVTGAAILACHAGLRGYSTGRNCLYGVTYLNVKRKGVELMKDVARICTLDCTDSKLTPNSDPCASMPHRLFQGKIAYQTYAHLPPEKKAALRAWYIELVYILERIRDEKQYAAAGGDGRRVQLQELIAVSVAEDMLPLGLKKLGGRPNFKFPRVYELPGKAVAATGSYGLIPDITFSLSAFASKLDEDWIAASPDFLMAVMIHEFIHASKPHFSLIGQAINMAVALSEVMAYDVADRHPLFPYLQSTVDREGFLKTRDQNIALFKKLWTAAPTDAKKQVVNWAWGFRRGEKDWMSTQMYVHPTDDGGIWGLLCGFNGSNGGRGPCGMEIQQ